MSFRSLNEVLLDLINEKTIDRVSERFADRTADCSTGENKNTGSLLAELWKENLSALKNRYSSAPEATLSCPSLGTPQAQSLQTDDPHSTSLAEGTRTTHSTDLSWRLVEPVQPLPVTKTQNCIGAPPARRKRPRGFNEHTKGLLYGLLTV